jgi:hypothetical protein
MTYIITILLILLFLACMRQANNMSRETPNRLKCGLILIMFSVAGLGYCALIGFFRRLDLIELIISVVFVTGTLLWVASERRIAKSPTR